MSKDNVMTLRSVEPGIVSRGSQEHSVAERATVFRFRPRAVPDESGATTWQAWVVGEGEYARVFRATETLYSSARGPERSIERSIVAKVFLDNAPDDYDDVFHGEVDALRRLGQHESIVSLRGVIDRLSPTYICGHQDCGEVYQLQHCPLCKSPLRNDEQADIVLRCEGGHKFHRSNPEHVERLTSQRACQHQEPCAWVNFLFRPCLFLEEYELNLREFNDLALRNPAIDVIQRRGQPRLHTRSEQGSAEWMREVFLMRLESMIEVARGLAYVHSEDHLHTDIAPDNVMTCVQRLAGDGSAMLQQPRTCLIDFGRSRPRTNFTNTTTVRGRLTFLAPEQMLGRSPVGPRVRLEAEGDYYVIYAPKGSYIPLEPRDSVDDIYGGQYEVVETTDPDSGANEGSPAQSTITRADAVKTVRIARIRVLRPPHQQRDLSSVLLYTMPSVGIPADVYSFGCLLAWTITSGNEQLVRLFRSLADVATNNKVVVDQSFARSLLGEQDYRKAIEAIPLPMRDEEQEIRNKLLHIVFRCLVRAKGAYCERRSSASTKPMGELGEDLNAIRDYLFLLFKQDEKLEEWIKSTNSRLVSELERSHRRFHYWRGGSALATTLAFAFGLGIGTPWYSKVSASGEQEAPREQVSATTTRSDPVGLDERAHVDDDGGATTGGGERLEEGEKLSGDELDDEPGPGEVGTRPPDQDPEPTVDPDPEPGEAEPRRVEPGMVTVPDMTGMKMQPARRLLRRLKLGSLEMDWEDAKRGQKSGTIVKQQPAAGTTVPSGARVRLYGVL